MITELLRRRAIKRSTRELATLIRQAPVKVFATTYWRSPPVNNTS